MHAVLSIALPVFAVIAVGFFAGKRHILSKEDAAALNRLVFNFSMPAALFVLTSNISTMTVVHLKLALSYAIASFIVITIAYHASKKIFALTPQEAGAHAFASTLGNAVFLGLPIALSIPLWAENFVVLMLIEGVLIIAIAAVLMSPRGNTSLSGALLKPFRNPLVAAMALGLLFSGISEILNIGLPETLTNFLDILGRAAGPTALFSLGLFLATNKITKFDAIVGRIGAIFLMKMAVLPAITLGCLFLLGVYEPTIIGPAALFTLVPTGVGAYIMASQYKNYTSECAAAVATTTAFSVVTISTLLAFFA